MNLFEHQILFVNQHLQLRPLLDHEINKKREQRESGNRDSVIDRRCRERQPARLHIPHVIKVKVRQWRRNGYCQAPPSSIEPGRESHGKEEEHGKNDVGGGPRSRPRRSPLRGSPTK